MARLEDVARELEKKTPKWKTEREAFAYWYASHVFARMYQDTSVRHRLMDALKFADEHWDTEKTLDDNHSNFVVKAVIESTIDDWANKRHSRSIIKRPEEPLLVDFSRILVDLFYVYHTYWRRYHRTLRGGTMRDKEWELMLRRFESLTPLDRVVMFEEFVSVMLAESESNDWILIELAPLLSVDEPTSQLIKHICERQDFREPVGRKTWESITSASIIHIASEGLKSLPIPEVA